MIVNTLGLYLLTRNCRATRVPGISSILLFWTQASLALFSLQSKLGTSVLTKECLRYLKYLSVDGTVALVEHFGRKGDLGFSYDNINFFLDHFHPSLKNQPHLVAGITVIAYPLVGDHLCEVLSRDNFNTHASKSPPLLSSHVHLPAVADDHLFSVLVFNLIDALISTIPELYTPKEAFDDHAEKGKKKKEYGHKMCWWKGPRKSDAPKEVKHCSDLDKVQSPPAVNPQLTKKTIYQPLPAQEIDKKNWKGNIQVFEFLPQAVQMELEHVIEF